MALMDTGTRMTTLTGENARATDGDGQTVIISASNEAVRDNGWRDIFDAASRKYDAGDVEPDSDPPLVRVTKADCDA